MIIINILKEIEIDWGSIAEWFATFSSITLSLLILRKTKETDKKIISLEENSQNITLFEKRYEIYNLLTYVSEFINEILSLDPSGNMQECKKIFYNCVECKCMDLFENIHSIKCEKSKLEQLKTEHKRKLNRCKYVFKNIDDKKYLTKYFKLLDMVFSFYNSTISEHYELIKDSKKDIDDLISKMEIQLNLI